MSNECGVLKSRTIGNLVIVTCLLGGLALMMEGTNSYDVAFAGLMLFVAALSLGERAEGWLERRTSRPKPGRAKNSLK